MRSRRFVIFVLIAASLVALGSAAHADNRRRLSAQNRFFCCTNPNLFLLGAPKAQFGFHSVVALGSVMGVPPQTLTIGMGDVARFFSMRSTPMKSGGPPYGVHTFSVSNATGTLMKGGGNAGAFSFCPKYVGLPIPGAGCAHPAMASPTYGYNGREFNGQIKVTPGKNKFGGTLQILAGPGGVGGTRFVSYRLVGAMGTQLPAQFASGGIDAAPIGASFPGYATILPAPQMTGYPPDLNSMSYPDAALWLQGAGKFTTGMLTLRVTMQPGPFPVRTVMLAGFDSRGPSGYGYIQLVSGLVVNRYDGPSSDPWPAGWLMRIHVPEPDANLGLAAGVLALLWIGSRHARREARRGE